MVDRSKSGNFGYAAWGMALLLPLLVREGLADEAPAAPISYGELQVLQDYENRDSKLGHLSLGAFGGVVNRYLDSKGRWTNRSGFSWLVESAPIFQSHLDGDGGNNLNNETNLIAQWSAVDREDPGRGNLLVWYQVSATWSSQTTSELMSKAGVITPPNGGDTFPENSRDLAQLFAWEQKLAGERVRIQIGKLTTRVLFNLNRFAVSDREDFFTPMLVNNPVVHYTARAGLGVFAEYKQPRWYVSGMVRDADANLSKRFIDFDSLGTGNWEYVAEAALTPANVGKLGAGNYRVTVSYSDATADVDSTTTLSLSFDQDLWRRVGGYFRFAVARDTFRSIRQRIAVGAQLKRPLGFVNDRIGLAVWVGDPAEEALQSEQGLEVFWKLQLARFLEVTADLQVIFNPARQEEHDRVLLGGARIRLLF